MRLALLMVAMGLACALDPNNVCTFRIEDKLYSLSFMEKTSYFTVEANGSLIAFDFCVPFRPKECPLTTPKAFAFAIKDGCHPYSTDSQGSLFTLSQGANSLTLQLILPQNNGSSLHVSRFNVMCGVSKSFQAIQVLLLTDTFLWVKGQSVYGCPLFEVSALWRALQSNELLFGVILFLLGSILLCFGVLMMHLTIFIASYFISFAVIGGIFTIFLSPNSSGLLVYFCLLLILFLSTVVAYALTRFLNVELFFIGAFLGFILAALLNSLFCTLTGLYSIYSLIIFEVILTVSLGLLAFKYEQQVIVVSSSVTGAYLIVRPLSWIFGGFPNQFTLQRADIPFAFYLYLAGIVVLAFLGALYQLLKIKRRDNPEAHSPNIIYDTVEESIDAYKGAVDKIIAQFKSTPDQQHYQLMEDNKERSRKSSGSQGRKSQGSQGRKKKGVRKDVQEKQMQNF